MSDRKLLPSALRAELGDHASLMRAMRTEHLLNLTAKLIEHFHEDTRPKEQPHNRDQWTRWPLADPPLPDWDFADEVGVIIRQEFVQKRGRERLELDWEEEDYVEGLVQQLAPILINFLENIFVLLEAHIFPRAPSLFNRINPLNWRDLANILASPMAQHLVNAQVLGRYVNRMEAMLGSGAHMGVCEPCPWRALERRRVVDQQCARRKGLRDRLVYPSTMST